MLGGVARNWTKANFDENQVKRNKGKFAKQHTEEIFEREAVRDINGEDRKLFKKYEEQSKQIIANINDISKIGNKIKEVAEYTQNIELENVSEEVAKEIYSAVYKIVSKYPQLKGGVGISLAEKITNNGFADVDYKTKSIHIDKNLFIDKELLKNEYQYCLDTAFHPLNTTYRALITHEYGHIMQHYIEDNLGIKAKQIQDEVFNRANIKFVNKDIIKEKLSAAANENPQEFFAEAFTEYTESPSPRKIAKVFGKYLFELLSTL